MQLPQLPQRELGFEQAEGIGCALVEGPQAVDGDADDLLMFAAELVHVVDGHEPPAVDGSVGMIRIGRQRLDGAIAGSALIALEGIVGGLGGIGPGGSVGGPGLPRPGEADVAGREHIEVGHGDHPTAIVTVGLVEYVQLDRCPVDQPGLLAQAAGNRFGQAFLRTQDRPRQLPHPIAWMGEENMQTTAGHGAEDRGVDGDRRPRELRELALIRHALRIARTRRVGECRSPDQGP